MVLSSVDLPTLGRPTRATKPERNAHRRSHWLGAARPVAGRWPPTSTSGATTTSLMRRPSTFVAVKRWPANSTLSPSVGTWPRVPKTNPPTVSQSSSGSATSSSSFSSSMARPPSTCSSPVGQVLDVGVLDVVLVDDLADQLLEAVLQRHQAGRAAVLVDEQRHVELLGLHLAHEPGDRLGLGHEAGRAGQAGHRLEAAALALGAHQVLGVGDAERRRRSTRRRSGSRE